jgi:hypothetical protein
LLASLAGRIYHDAPRQNANTVDGINRHVVTLSDSIRAALDRRVDPVRLEQFLTKYPWTDKTRHSILNCCLRDPEAGIPVPAQFLDPVVQTEWEDVWANKDSL